MGRRERQSEEIMSALERRQYARVLVLSREHLAEFPDDEEVRAAGGPGAAADRRGRDG